MSDTETEIERDESENTEGKNIAHKGNKCAKGSARGHVVNMANPRV